jgi:hypothetical protein
LKRPICSGSGRPSFHSQRLVLLADLLPHAPGAHALTPIQGVMLPLNLRTRIAKPQLLRFIAHSQYGAIIVLRLWYPVIAHVDRVDDFAHVWNGGELEGLTRSHRLRERWF